MIVKVIAASLLVGWLACALMAQEAPAAQGAPSPAATQQSPPKEPGEHHHGFGMHDGLHGPGHHAGDWLRRYQNVPPEQQEQALANDPEFQKLPPERQERLRRRLREFNAMTPEQRQHVLDRMETFEHLTPEQQERARAMFARFRDLPEARRQMVKRALRNLREMDPQQRSQILGSEKFRGMFSADELEVLKGMSEIVPPRPPENSSDHVQAPPPDRQ